MVQRSKHSPTTVKKTDLITCGPVGRKTARDHFSNSYWLVTSKTKTVAQVELAVNKLRQKGG